MDAGMFSDSATDTGTCATTVNAPLLGLQTVSCTGSILPIYPANSAVRSGKFMEVARLRKWHIWRCQDSCRWSARPYLLECRDIQSRTPTDGSRLHFVKIATLKQKTNPNNYSRGPWRTSKASPTSFVFGGGPNLLNFQCA